MFIRIWVLMVFFLGFIAEGFSKDIVAGFSSYKHILDTNFEIKYILIGEQEADGSAVEDEIIVQVFTYNGSFYSHEANVRVFLSETFNFDHGEYNDFAEQNKLNYVYGEYIMDYTLFDPSKDYVFVYQRCCRSTNISNMANPETSGVSLLTTITSEAQALRNSSIEFDALPSIIRSENTDDHLPIQVNSLDGDTLSFQLSPTYLGGGIDGISGGYAESCTGTAPQGPCYPPYQQIEFSSDLSFFNPFPGWDEAGMDGQTGALQGTAATIGQFAYGFTIHENRDGRIINSTSFDYLAIVALLTTSSETVENDKLKVLGNPSSGKFTLDLGQKENFRFAAYSMGGNEIGFNTSGNSGIIDLEIQGPSGVYILKASDGKQVESIKLIKL